jgi:hypothetical protein
MNPSNVIHLEGCIHGPTWLRWIPGGLGEVRFCVSVPGAAGRPDDVFTCAIAGVNSATVAQLEFQLNQSRRISLNGSARPCDRVQTRDEPLVLIVVESYELDQASCAAALPTAPRRHHAHGKAAAAGDDAEAFQLASA